MALVFANVAEVEALKNVLYQAPEALLLKLYKNDYTPVEGDTAGAFTEADFTGYAAKTLLATNVPGVTWAVPTTDGGGVTSSSYGTVQTFTWGSTQTVYGYYFIGAVSGLLRGAQRFTNPRVFGPTDFESITPRIEMA